MSGTSSSIRSTPWRTRRPRFMSSSLTCRGGHCAYRFHRWCRALHLRRHLDVTVDDATAVSTTDGAANSCCPTGLVLRLGGHTPAVPDGDGHETVTERATATVTQTVNNTSTATQTVNNTSTVTVTQPRPTQTVTTIAPGPTQTVTQTNQVRPDRQRDRTSADNDNDAAGHDPHGDPHRHGADSDGHGEGDRHRAGPTVTVTGPSTTPSR